MKQNKLVVKSHKDKALLNRKITKLAVTMQVAVEAFDSVACEKELWNKAFKNQGNAMIAQMEKVQKAIYDKNFEQYENQFSYAEQAYDHLIEMLMAADMDTINDAMGFIELRNTNKELAINFLKTNIK